MGPPLAVPTDGKERIVSLGEWDGRGEEGNVGGMKL
jgi:hypothetical protein